MKKILYILLLISASLQAQTTYYVATDGNNVNNGTSTSTPWATWQHAMDNATTPGDTVYYRGGTYSLGAGEIVVLDPANLEGLGVHGDSGTYANHIVHINYPGETPILDASGTTSYENAFLVRSTTYTEFIGLTVRGKTYDTDPTDIIRQVGFYDNGWIKIERFVSDSSYGYGFTINDWDTLYLYNCDSYEHANPDHPTDPGNKPDGFAIASGGQTTDYGEVIGNRAWRCSDDGMETSWGAGMLLDSNWVFCNGYLSGGAGVGIKYGTSFIEDSLNRITQRCIAAYNTGTAYDFENMHHPTNGAVMIFKNNLSFRNMNSFGVVIGDWNEDTGDYNLKYYNNIAYNNDNASLDQYAFPEFAGSDPDTMNLFEWTNTWDWNPGSSYLWQYDSDVAWSYADEDAQWITLPDSARTLTVLSAPRKADGSLPDIGDNFKLASTSVLIDAGTDVGLPYSGDAPDLGPFEDIPAAAASPKKIGRSNGAIGFDNTGAIMQKR